MNQREIQGCWERNDVHIHDVNIILASIDRADPLFLCFSLVVDLNFKRFNIIP